MAELESRLRRTNQKQAALYLFCNFISLMLMTAYSGLMFSPTVQDIFPPGGDSRKQLYAIFVLALFGCVIFTIYAASLFFRKKSRQLGILMALGASRKTLAPGLFREVLLLSGSSAVLGTLAGFPFLFLLWTAFRIFIVNSEEMVLNVDFRCLWVSAGFTALVVICACVLAFLYMKRTNILDVIQEEHQNEPVKELGRWCGPVGIVLILAGAVAGYEGPTVYMNVFHRYPSPFLNLLYAPALQVLHGHCSHSCQRLDLQTQKSLEKHHCQKYDEISGKTDGKQSPCYYCAGCRRLLRDFLSADASYRTFHGLRKPHL